MAPRYFMWVKKDARGHKDTKAQRITKRNGKQNHMSFVQLGVLVSSWPPSLCAFAIADYETTVSLPTRNSEEPYFGWRDSWR